ncbi:MAG: NADH dehydrogenase (quinone) subunit D [Deltaproteobacteria bacterium]|nr:NADH dehydrogenase (quinone) subunit D [Deltaproteobacteria bacterium]
MVNMGPQHPSTHGVLRLVLELDGEVVVRCATHIGYLNTGIEKTMEAKRYTQIIPLTDRMDYLAPMSNNLAFCLAVEKLLGIEAPERAQTIRVLLAELTRIMSHLVWLGTMALEIGAQSVFLYCFREREKLLDIYEMCGGQRMMSSYFRIGGLWKDAPPEFEPAVRSFIAEFPDRLAEYEAILTRNTLWLQRTQGIGYLSAEDAIDLGVSGPTLRASGVPYDVRKSVPYSSYEQYDFEMVMGKNGDVYERYLCRIQEMKVSREMVRQALERLKPGPVIVDDPKLVAPPKREVRRSMEALIHHFLLYSQGFRTPPGEVYVPIESPRGELGFYIVSDGSNRPYRVKARTPSFANTRALERLVVGAMVADVVAIIGSIDNVMGDVDR